MLILCQKQRYFLLKYRFASLSVIPLSSNPKGALMSFTFDDSKPVHPVPSAWPFPSLEQGSIRQTWAEICLLQKGKVIYLGATNGCKQSQHTQGAAFPWHDPQPSWFPPELLNLLRKLVFGWIRVDFGWILFWLKSMSRGQTALPFSETKPCSSLLCVHVLFICLVCFKVQKGTKKSDISSNKINKFEIIKLEMENFLKR